MLFMPKRDWQWKYNDEHEVLSVLLGDEVEFLTPYSKKQLIPDALMDVKFDVTHAKFYLDLIDRLQRALKTSDAGLVQIVLNATAAHFMLQSQMPKSWFFKPSSTCVFSENGKVFTLRTEMNNETLLVLAVDAGLQSTCVMVLSAECAVSDKKTLKQFDVIKVMNDRLSPLQAQKHTAAA
ncbi:cell division protein ZapC [Parashewanella curva]|uniref:Cell division protein ZapC n=1 Tax=Parashewanella curva TaxID=2338552 RepID=A0A3L8PXI7_9GAMM|nr:cell division protein ZapC [Parashewanella curva]RLV60041.1 cell division protein ZapC [Parashewanella curva]